MGKLTTHVLDTSGGCPAKGLTIALYRIDGDTRKLCATATTNEDGRCDGPLLDGDTFITGIYELVFEAGAYFDAAGFELPAQKFLDVIVLRFGISAEDDHYHVPLLLSPYSYSTYRGS